MSVGTETLLNRLSEFFPVNVYYFSLSCTHSCSSNRSLHHSSLCITIHIIKYHRYVSIEAILLNSESHLPLPTKKIKIK